ncbi:MAG TPA: TraB/GumN family protein [Sphingomicrobium sp.]|nr:TraB/GumN family protein [Sphingomicrobium sp.]
MFKTMVRRGLALLGLFTVTSCTVPAPATTVAPATARPALWQVADRDTTIYLFGTIHMLPQNYAWRTPALDQALGASQTLVVETILDESNPQAIVAEMSRIGFATGLPPLAERVSPAKRPLLEAAMARQPVPRAAFDRMKTWAAAFMLLGTQFQELGLSGGQGVDAVLKREFAAAGKPIQQLETNAEQLGFFDGLPEPVQRSLLESALESSQAMRTEFNKMLDAWARGDVRAIGDTFNKHLSETPDLRDALVTRRNQNWSRWIEQRMASPGTVFVAVGAGHLAGPDSVQQLLQKRGYRIRRVQ